MSVILAIIIISSFFTGIIYNETSSPVHLQILAVNDFHGHLFPGHDQHNRSAGGAPFLASSLKAVMNTPGNGNVILTLTGDTVGASPRYSALLLDEPTVLFFNIFANENCMGRKEKKHDYCNVISIPGNHEFNNGPDELFRKVKGGNGSSDIPHIVDPYPGMAADVICANVVWKENDTPLFPPYTIRYIEGIPVAFIGAVSIETPILELPMNVEMVKFLNESDGINRYIPSLQEQGVHAFVVLLHEGGNQESYEGPTRTGCNVTGPVENITAQLDPDVDVVLASHSHDFTNAYLPNTGKKDVLVVQAYSYGKAYADVNVSIDRRSRDIISKSAIIVPVYADQAGVEPDPDIQRLLEDVQDTVSQVESEFISTTIINISRIQNKKGESSLGNLVADSQRDAMGTEIAFVTSGELAGSLHADIPAGIITWADLERVLPPDASMAEEYGGWYSRPRVASRELNGSQIKDILERQWEEPKPEENLSVSGLVYWYNLSRPVGDKVTRIWVNGNEISHNATYSVAMNYYMAYGMGEFTPGWDSGVNVTIGPADIDALESYFRKLPVPFNLIDDSRVVEENNKKT
ncbi:bifunctional metallophosphatase/5'-nucleotidase [Methanospirillum purgamenti]|uniref:Bifunctional metallophosphatase/5'-nucleotidase n=1 Tax=Methanospirillum hungatei TaxID=2203 RepID=A0A8F5VMW8_METHU|nr:bifunctional metallophosphatase/5'-nucleotidase [Methanospirillum hungatei]QXO95749.1 bifunctional metallophosphatase/5'-nucleotidase [Methanospirillum hungatei]